MKTKLYFIRHAEAEGNVYRRIHGQYDSLLTSNGLRQLPALRERFREEKVDVCYSSDLIRARTTAQAVYLPKGLPLRLDRRLREAGLGDWEDMPFGLLEREDAEQLNYFNNDPDKWRVPHAERYAAYSTRFRFAVEELARRHAGQSVALFTHGCILRSLLFSLFPEEKGHSDNTAVSCLEYENGVFRAVYLNDNSHVPVEISTLARQNWWRGGADHNLWFRPMEGGEERLLCARRALWDELYGLPFPDGPYYRRALEGAAGLPDALCDAMLGDQPVGLLQLDLRWRWGHISFLYLAPEYRGKGFGTQLLGQAVSVFRRLGKTRLRLHVSPRNEAALAFYRGQGFRTCGSVTGAFGELLVLELDFRPDRDLAAEQLVAVTPA